MTKTDFGVSVLSDLQDFKQDYSRCWIDTRFLCADGNSSEFIADDMVADFKIDLIR